MARLPEPGSDDGLWGDILNSYLLQAHDSDGDLKASVVGTSNIIDTAVTEAKLSSAVQTKINTVAPVLSVNGQTGTVVLTKTDLSLGNVDNTSDANKPVSTATTAALSGKSDTGHAHAASDVTSGTLNIARIPTGTSGTTVSLGNHAHDTADITSGIFAIGRIPTGSSSSTVSLGNHAHTGVYLPIKNGNPTLTDSTNDMFARVDISDDASPTASWADRLAFYFNGTRSGYHNEYGELRARPAKSNTVAFRAQKWASSSTVDIMQITSSDNSTLYFTVGPTASTLSVPLTSTASISTSGTVTASNISAKVTASSSAPSSPSVGDVWIDLSA